MKNLAILLAWTMGMGVIGSVQGALTIVSPRCEGSTESLGLRRAAPRFTWGLSGEENGIPVAEVRVLRDGDVLWT